MMTKDAVPFGERLRRLREAAGLTQERLAEQAGLSIQGVAALERGRSRRPYPHTVRALADALKLSPDEHSALLSAIPSRNQRGDDEDVTSAAFTTEARLPSLDSPLIGREQIMDEISDLIAAGTRLVTLTGPGGVGKTSLAIHLAASLGEQDLFPDGVTFVALAPLTDSRLLLPTIVQTLRLPFASGGSAIATLRQHMHDSRMLLVLDNLEHIIDTVPDVADLLQACEGVVVIATSRAPLRIRGEREYPVPTLDVPTLDRIPQVQDVADTAAVELFVTRAREANPSFRLEQENACVVAAICRRLDGLPLAIELAAARLRALSPLELLARLDTTLPLLSSGARDLPDRQRTMTRAIEWSHDLLTDDERAVFQRLSVFRGGWTIDALGAIGETLTLPDADVINLLSSLVEQSLVATGHTPDGYTRYRMLVPIREFAGARLEASGHADQVKEAHVQYFLTLTEEASAGLEGATQVTWLTRLEAERNNLRAAMDWLGDAGKLDELSRIGWNLWVFLWIRGNHAEARERMRRVYEHEAAAPPATRARAMGMAAAMSFALGDLPTAMRLAHESQAEFVAAEDEVSAARSWLVLGLISSARDDRDVATQWLDRGASVLRGHASWFWAALSTIARGMIPYRAGDYDASGATLADGYVLSRTAGDRFSRYIALYDMSRLAQARGDLREAATLFREGFAFSMEVGDRANMAYCLEGLASVAAMHHDPHLAARLLGRAETLFEAAGARMYTYRPDSKLQETTLASVRQQLEPEALAFEWREGTQMSIEDLLDLALPLSEPGRRAAEPALTQDVSAPDTELRSRFGLTRRETEILRLLMHHYSYRQISDELFISPRTVGTHITSINRKMGVSSRQEAAQIASKLGLA